MSWDILVINSNKPVDFEKGDWSNFNSRKSVISKITTTFPQVSWDNFSWGVIDAPEAVIEFNIGESEEMGNNFMLHIRGGKNPTEEISKMCRENDWVAYDISTDSFINSESGPESFEKWENYRNQVLNTGVTSTKKSWWKFW